MSPAHPWNSPVMQALQQREAGGKLPHALLFTGIDGLGKTAFANEFAQWLFCTEQAGPNACGHCRNCQLFAAGNHPDITFVSVPEDKTQITVDQIRALSGYINLTPQFSERKIAIITTAEKMNTAAANSLLKTLEEPSGNTLIILLTSHFSQLLPTIRSRCQRIEFPAPPAAEAVQWLQSQKVENPELLLKLAYGAPLKAKAFADAAMLEERGELFEMLKKLAARKLDPVEQAEKWSKKAPQPLLYMLASWVVDMIRLKLTSQNDIINSDQHKSLHNMANSLEPMALYKYHDQVKESQQLLNRSANVQMMLEKLFITWVSIFPRVR